MRTWTKFLVPGLVVVLLVAAAVVMFGAEDRKTLTASFPRSISIYEGSDVRVLGVPVGQVEQVTPSGTEVEVRMTYDAEVQVPADARAAIVAPSVVGDRFIQLTPVYEGGEVMPDNAVLDTQRTATPVELDEIYASLDDLNVALGPDGANKEGALTDLLRRTAENFSGQGERFNQTITDLGTFTGTLDNNKEELFGAVEEMEGFISTLAENDDTVRAFNSSLAEVSEMLEGERDELARSLRHLGVAMEQVTSFVEENRDQLGENITGLNRVSKVLVKQRDALHEVLSAGPLAANNLALTYNPETGTLDTRANLGNLAHEVENNPDVFLCSLISQVDDSGRGCDLIDTLLPRAGAFGETRRWEPQQQFDLTLSGLVEEER